MININSYNLSELMGTEFVMIIRTTYAPGGIFKASSVSSHGQLTGSSKNSANYITSFTIS